MTTATYTVDGMMCGACIAEVMERIRLLPGVSGVAVRFVPNGPSPLFIESPVALASEAVRETVEIVGFHASGTSKHVARHLRRTFQLEQEAAQLVGRTRASPRRYSAD